MTIDVPPVIKFKFHERYGNKAYPAAYYSTISRLGAPQRALVLFRVGRVNAEVHNKYIEVPPVIKFKFHERYSSKAYPVTLLADSPEVIRNGTEQLGRQRFFRTPSDSFGYTPNVAKFCKSAEVDPARLDALLDQGENVHDRLIGTQLYASGLQVGRRQEWPAPPLGGGGGGGVYYCRGPNKEQAGTVPTYIASRIYATVINGQIAVVT
ncbi:hypothetical protein DFH09DRAFT_1402119 [Mycena vulgaris]|nr:hypothetical protein DFH09DRAFT_1402119 [Mycena vulgaris]